MKTLLIALGLIFAVTLKGEDGIVVKKQKETLSVQFQSKTQSWATLQVKDMTGEVILEQQMAAIEGNNAVPVFFASKLKKGTYTFELKIEDKVYSSKFAKE